MIRTPSGLYVGDVLEKLTTEPQSLREIASQLESWGPPSYVIGQIQPYLRRLERYGFAHHYDYRGTEYWRRI